MKSKIQIVLENKIRKMVKEQLLKEDRAGLYHVIMKAMQPYPLDPKIKHQIQNEIVEILKKYID